MIQRNPYVSAAFSLLTPGLGHVYAGQAKRFFLGFIAVHFVIAVLGLLGLLTTYFGAWAYAILVLSLVPFGIVDSFVATKRRGILSLKWYNHWYFYVGFVAIVISLIAGHRLFRPALGFDLYRVKGGDVPPVVKRFDFVVVDTKAFVQRIPQEGDVVLVRRPEAGVFIGRVTQSSSPAAFSYVVGTEGIEHSGVPLSTVVGKPTYVFYSRVPDSAGKQIY